MTADDRDLAEHRQAIDDTVRTLQRAVGAATAARELARPCTWRDDAWHRAVQRLCRIHRGDYIRLLSEERRSTTRAEVTDPYEGLHGAPEHDDTDDPRAQP